MSILNDKQITELGREGLVTPFREEQVEEGVISFGVGSFGYDIRASEEAEVIDSHRGREIDPKNFDTEELIINLKLHEDEKGSYFVIPQNSFALLHSEEEFDMPEDVMGVVVGKSTYARCGLIVNITPVEAGWSGYLTIEVSNTTHLPARVYAHEGIAQILFFRGQAPKNSYADKAGKYQNQPKEIVHPKIANQGDDSE